MHRISRYFLFCLSVLALLSILELRSHSAEAQQLTPMPAISLDSLHSRDLQIDLGDGWTTKAQLTWPTQGVGPFPTVILFPPSGPNDMDASQQYTPTDPVIAANFRLMAQQLGLKGIAVLRFNKRGVRTYNDFDSAQVGKSAPRGREVADGESVIATALAQVEVDPKQMYLFGWSDGTLTVTQLAVYHPELAGIILQGAPNDPTFKGVLTHQWLEETVGYFRDTLDTNHDGKVSLDEMNPIPAFGVAAWASQSFSYSISTSDHPVLDRTLDTNSDGQIDIQNELIPYFQKQIDTIIATTPDRYVPSTADTLERLQVPVLLLAGENDGGVPHSDSQAIAQAVGQRATLKLYPGLGHALSLVSSPALDDFGAMQPQPIDDMAAWILAAK